MWSIARSPEATRTRWPRWKLLLLLVVGLCVLIQLLIVRGMWLESLFRQRVGLKGQFVLGPSPLPGWLETPLQRWIGPQKTDLLSPMVELILVDATESDWIAVASHSHIKTLDIVRGSPNSDSFRQLGWMRQLTMLSIRDVALDAKSLTGLSGCARLSRIQLLGEVTPEALESLKYCESLRELYLGDGDRFRAQESPFTAEHLAAISKIPNLNQLVIAAGKISGTELRGLAYARELVTLMIFDVRLQPDAINTLGRLPRLKELVLEPIDENYSYEPQAIKGFLALKSFSITNCRVSSAFAASLAKLPKLEALSFNRCWVNKGLPGLAGAPKLKLLDLSMTDATPEGFRGIGTLKGLESLLLPGYDSEDLDELKALCPHLQTSQAVNRKEYFTQVEWPRRRPSYGVGGGFF